MHQGSKYVAERRGRKKEKKIGHCLWQGHHLAEVACHTRRRELTRARAELTFSWQALLLSLLRVNMHVVAYLEFSFSFVQFRVLRLRISRYTSVVFPLSRLMALGETTIMGWLIFGNVTGMWMRTSWHALNMYR
jgi:hypothetical protein